MAGSFFDRLINDITTAPERAPAFGNGLPDYPRADFETKQKKVYPDVLPLALRAPADAAFAAVLALAQGMPDWQVEEVDKKARRLRAVARTAVLGFKDDIVVVVEPKADGSVVQMRSRSRVGKGDFGTNAKRIISFLALVKGRVPGI